MLNISACSNDTSLLRQSWADDKPPILNGNKDFRHSPSCKATVLSAIRDTAILRCRRFSHQATLGKHPLFTLSGFFHKAIAGTMLMEGLTLPET